MELIGKGSFSNIYKAYNIYNKKKFIIKNLLLKDENKEIHKQNLIHARNEFILYYINSYGILKLIKAFYI